ncbi:MAG: twin-arginine translocase TatA/TatE family subunit [Opitutaceae bacterium]|nr:twin-arginine translocase TatA/TatE family subunit [Opitutaceae bacterium]
MCYLPEPIAGLFGLGGPELIIILVILLLLFGGSKLPALAKGLGQSIKEFKNAAKDEPAEPKEEKKAEPAQKPGNN